MPNLHDIERRINSVSSTKQITRTMEMVAAAKIRRATERAENALPWANIISNMLISTAKYAPLEEEPTLQKHDEVKKAVVVVVTSDRGLAGGFNSNVLRHAEKVIKERQRKGIEVEVIACGKKAISYFTYRGVKPVFEFRDLSADPTYEEAAEISQYTGDGYHYGQNDEVILIFNHAKNSAEQVLIEQQVLPVDLTPYAEVLGLKPKEEDVFDYFRPKDLDSLPGDVQLRARRRHVPVRVDEGVFAQYVLLRPYRLCCRRAGRTPLGNEVGYRQRQRNGRDIDQTVQPCPSGCHHDRDHRDRRWRSGFGGINE